MRRMAIGVAALLLMAALGQSAVRGQYLQVNIFARPDGVTSDFTSCKDAQTRLEKFGCAATGVIACGTKPLTIYGTAFLVNVTDRVTDVIATVAHVFFDKNGRERDSCAFYAAGQQNFRFKIISIVFGVRGNNQDIKQNDWAVAAVEGWPSEKFGAFGYAELNTDKVQEVIDEGIKFMQFGWLIPKHELVFSQYGTPIPPSVPQLGRDHTDQLSHSLNALEGFSGGPQVALVGGDDLRAYCVHSGAFNSDKSPPGTAFDPQFNPNKCTRIAGKFMATLERVARGQKIGTSQAP